jgi:peptide/nickel transport system permease protein
MLAFILTRVANAILVMLIVAFVAFSLFNFVGDPVTNMLGENAPPDRKAELRLSLGLDEPMPVRFLRFLQHAVVGDFGMSFRNLQPVSSVLIARLPATLELSLMAVLLARVWGFPPASTRGCTGMPGPARPSRPSPWWACPSPRF